MSLIGALQGCLAAEHAAVYVAGYLGAQTSASASPDLYGLLEACYERHLERRDALADAVAAAGADPVAAAASYQLGDVAGDDAAIMARAVRLERDCGAAYGFLVASSTGDQRRYAVDTLVDTALRELDFGGAPRRYPGR